MHSRNQVVLAYGSLTSDIIVGHVSPWLANECQASVVFMTHWFLMFDFIILHLNGLRIQPNPAETEVKDMALWAQL